MRSIMSALGALLLALHLITAESASLLRGVQPDLAAVYALSGSSVFRCLDGRKSVNVNAVNDGYCDCYDGSDEPGTSACPNGKFYCDNAGFEPRLLNSSFVDDGVCDCCDGSDEASGRCGNTCKQQGVAALQQLKEDVAAAEAGLRSRSKYIKAAASLRATWASRISEISRLEPVAERKTKETTSTRDRLVSQLTKLQAKLRRLQAAAAPPAPAPSPDADTTAEIEPEEPEAAAEADHRAVDSSTEEGGAAVEEEESADDLARRVASQWIPGAAGGDGDERGEDEDDEIIEDEAAEEDWDAEATEADDDDLDLVDPADSGAGSADADMGDLDLGFFGEVKFQIARLLATLTGKRGDAAGIEEAKAAVSALQSRVDAARNAASQASSDAESLRSEKGELQEKQGIGYGPDDVYAPLADRCIETKVDKYTYRVCPFKEAEQVEGEHGHTSLGRWGGFDEDMEHMKFKDGDHCWQGPQRSITVRVRCGATEVLTRIAEPSRCVYSAELSTPAACSQAYVDELRAALAAKQARLDSVKDEL